MEAMLNNLTYLQLLKELKTLTQEQLNQTVTVYFPGEDEFYPATKVCALTDSDVLDPHHIILTIQESEF